MNQEEKAPEISQTQLIKILKVVKPLLDKKLENAKAVLNEIKHKNAV
jgi:hypothetical protein